MSKKRALAQRLRLAPPNPSVPFYKFVLRALPTMVLVSLTTLALEHLGWTEGFETTALDTLISARSEPPSENVMLITIDDEDYQTLFAGHSPLEAAKLHDLLKAVAAGKPRVIGVDIDTSASEFADFEWPEAVWARDALPIASSEDHQQQAVNVEESEFRRFPILGGKMSEELHDGTIITKPASGLVIFPQDSDGVVRRYVRTLESDEADPPSKRTGEVATLPWAVTRQYAAKTRAQRPDNCPECERVEAIERGDEKGELVLNFAGDRYRFNRIPARAVLAGAKQDFWAERAPIRDKIVLVGGAFRAARDEYPTPVGQMYGVELIAQAIESDLRGGGIREVNWLLIIVIDFASSVILLYINWRFPGGWTATLSLIAIVVLSLAGSYLAFRAFAYWFNFSAVLLGIWIHSLWEQSLELRELRREVDHLKGQLASRNGTN
jgi:CHASE2 domain-containing sensor protein